VKTTEIIYSVGIIIKRLHN